MWFNEKHLQTNTQIKINDLYGYVLPHAGTSHTGHIISHTLRFIPNRKISKIIGRFGQKLQGKNKWQSFSLKCF